MGPLKLQRSSLSSQCLSWEWTVMRNEEVRGTFAVFVSLQKFTVSKQSCIKEKSPKGGKVKNKKKSNNMNSLFEQVHFTNFFSSSMACGKAENAGFFGRCGCGKCEGLFAVVNNNN